MFFFFLIILVITGAPLFFCTLTSFNSVSEPRNQVCVLGAINERFEALCDIHMYVCMCLKVSVNFSQPVRVFVFFHNTELVNIILRILNLEGHTNCMIASKVTTILMLFFFSSKKKLKTIKVGMWGVYPEAIDWNIVLDAQILF